MSAAKEERFWLNPVIEKIESQYPSGEIIVSSGISPSASYHIGHFREILSGDIIRTALVQKGRQAKHLHVVDNFDPLRKRYDFLPEEYEQYVGWPVCLVPDPEGCHDSYAEHFFQEFYQWIERLDIEVEVIRSYQDLYKSGRLAPQIEKAVANVDVIKTIFKEVSNRDLNEDWMPLQILSDDNSFNDWRFKSIHTKTKEIEYMDHNGSIGRVRYDDGRVKLNWRLDWPARWQALGVQVEPHGFQEHGASGGSFDTGVRFAREVFGFEPPLAGFQYGHVHLSGDNLKMSSSKGNLITPAQAFSIMPPELLRYFYARFPGKKRIDFDPGIGLARMYDEFAEVAYAAAEDNQHEFRPAYEIATAGIKQMKVSQVPFTLLVNAYQAARKNNERTLEVLKRSEYANIIDEQSNAIELELGYVDNWLQSYAPDSLVFELQDILPEVAFDENQQAFVDDLADRIEHNADATPDGQWYHEQIYAAKDARGLEPKAAFQALYRLLLNQDFGPKAGWFLSTLDKKWLVNRLRRQS